MKQTQQTERYAVYDDVLSEQDAQLRDYPRHVPLRSPHVPAYNRIWSFEEGSPLMSPIAYAFASVEHGRAAANLERNKGRVYPTDTPLDAVLRTLLQHAERFEPLVGVKGKDWLGVTASMTVYPAGAGLDWHDDQIHYTGAFSFYAHPRWDMDWGGELMVLDGAPDRDPKQVPEHVQVDPLRRDTLKREDYLRSAGSFVVPAPNRLVVLKGGTCHRVNPVRACAGRIPRIAVSGFFIPPGKGLETLWEDPT